MTVSLIVLLASMMSGQAGPAPGTSSPVTIVPEGEARLADEIGTCAGPGRSFNLRWLMPLADRSAEMDSPRGPRRISLQGEHLFIYAVDRHGPERAIFGINIGDEADPLHDLDVELRLAYFEGNLVVYWKETFQHRIYRQGMFGIESDRVTFLCAGVGGTTTLD